LKDIWIIHEVTWSACFKVGSAFCHRDVWKVLFHSLLNGFIEIRSDVKLNKLQRAAVQLLISGVILAWLLILSDATKVWGRILTANSAYILGAILALIIGFMMIAFALYISLRNMGLKTHLKDTILASFGGQLLSDVTPARSGYFLTPFLLKKLDGTPCQVKYDWRYCYWCYEFSC